MLRSFRYLLLPFSLIYGGAVWLRNILYDKNIFKSASFNFPVICIGNLAAGGTGKTPMVEYLLRLLQKDYKPATLSRGYKRKTSGFAIANERSTALEIGDEPMQFHLKFPDVTVAVGEERLVAIPQLLHDRPDTELIILDDAFQHRPVKAGLNILLTEYTNLYTRDLMLPAGDLRDVRVSSRRADIIVVTKCKADLTEEEKNSVIKEIGPEPDQDIFFTTIVYGEPVHLFKQERITISEKMDVLLLCGIANPRPLKEYLNTRVHAYDMLRFPDHHIFNSDDLAEIKRHYEKIGSKNKLILTTEKDAVRLQKFEEQLKDLPIYAIPIEHKFLFDAEDDFREELVGFISKFEKVMNKE